MSPLNAKLVQAGAYALMPLSLIVQLFSVATIVESSQGAPPSYQYAVMGLQVSPTAYWMEEGLSLAGIVVGFVCLLLLLYQRLAVRAAKLAALELHAKT
jgi:hypothetical protein